MVVTSAIKAGQAYVELFTKDQKLVKGLKSASARLKRFSSTTQQVGRQLLSMSVVAATPFALATRTFTGFSDRMLTVKAVTGAVGEEFEKLNETAKALGRTTSFTAGQVAEGMVELGRAGFSTREILDAIPHILNLARGTATELGEAAMFAAAAVRAFNLDASETERVADVLTATANSSAQTLTDLGESLKYAAPIAADYGESIESVSKALGVMANMGIKGSMAGTSLRRIMLELTDASKQKLLMDEAGVRVLDESGQEMRALGDIMLDVGRAMSKLGTSQRLALMNTVFGFRGISAGLKLSGSIEQVEALDAAINAAGGTAQRTADTMDSGLGGTLRLLRSAFEGLAIAIGEAIEPLVTQLANKMREIAPAVRKWIEENQGLIVSVAKWTLRIGAAGAALLALGKTLGIVSGVLYATSVAVGVLQGAFVFLAANPAVLVFGGIAAAAVAAGLAIRALTYDTAELSDEATRLAKANDELRSADLDRLARLERLAKKEKLNSKEMAEARDLIKTLEKTYGDLGLAVDGATATLTGFADAQRKATEAMRAGVEAEIAAQIAQHQTNVAELQAEMQSISSWSEKRDNERIELLAMQADAENKLIHALVIKKKLLRQGDRSALTGQPSQGGAGLGDGGAGDIGAAISAITDENKLAEAERLLAEAENRLHELRLKSIEDEEVRAIAAIEHEYNEKLKRARELDMELTRIEEAREAEFAAIHDKYGKKRLAEKQRRAKEEAAAQADLQDEIARLQIQTTTEGLDEQLALIEFEREKALRDAAWTERGAINRRYDLERRLAEQGAADMAVPARSVRGTFNAAAIQSLQAGGGGPEAETARNTAAQLEEQKKTNRKLDKGVQVKLG
jgi:TP901 family phage tail tape measure protein